MYELHYERICFRIRRNFSGFVFRSLWSLLGSDEKIVKPKDFARMVGTRGNFLTKNLFRLVHAKSLHLHAYSFSLASRRNCQCPAFETAKCACDHWYTAVSSLDRWSSHQCKKTFFANIYVIQGSCILSERCAIQVPRSRNIMVPVNDKAALTPNQAKNELACTSLSARRKPKNH